MNRLIQSVGKSTLSKYYEYFESIIEGTLTKSEVKLALRLTNKTWTDSSINTKINAAIRLLKKYDKDDIQKEISIDRRLAA